MARNPLTLITWLASLLCPHTAYTTCVCGTTTVCRAVCLCVYDCSWLRWIFRDSVFLSYRDSRLILTFFLFTGGKSLREPQVPSGGDARGARLRYVLYFVIFWTPSKSPFFPTPARHLLIKIALTNTRKIFTQNPHMSRICDYYSTDLLFFKFEQAACFPEITWIWSNLPFKFSSLTWHAHTSPWILTQAAISLLTSPSWTKIGLLRMSFAHLRSSSSPGIWQLPAA